MGDVITIHTPEYYLHTNGDVIYKALGGVDETSDFVVQKWNCYEIGETPQTYCQWLLNLNVLGVDKERIVELAEFNELDEFIHDWKHIVFRE